MQLWLQRQTLLNVSITGPAAKRQFTQGANSASLQTSLIPTEQDQKWSSSTETPWWDRHYGPYSFALDKR